MPGWAIFLLASCLLLPGMLGAQVPGPADAYADEAAAELVRLARARRAVVDTRIRAYEVTAHERMSARLAAAGAERLVFRRETVSRIQWSRDTVRIELLGAREAQPFISNRAQLPPPDLAGFLPTLAFDPVDSEMLLRVDTTVIRHPLAPDSESFYRFASGGSSSIRLPDGRVVRLQELRVTARRPDPQLINGSFWLDADSHSIVRVAFRLSRGLSAVESRIAVLTPEAGGEVDHVAIDYGLWDLRWWLPRTMVASGFATVAGVRLPVSYERGYADYRITADTMAVVASEVDWSNPDDRFCRPSTFGSIAINVGAAADPAARDSAWADAWDRSLERLARGDSARTGRSACDRTFVVERASPSDLLNSPSFATDIFADAGGPVDEADLRELAAMLGSIPDNPWALGPPDLRILTPELIRFNRVEGLSGTVTATLPLGPADLRAELRGGSTGEVGARIGLTRAWSTLRGYLGAYRGLEAMEISSQPFSLTTTIGALLLGRDENDYFRATGGELRFSPPAARRQGWDLRLFAERQEPVRARTDVSLRALLDRDFEVRENVGAEPLRQVGAAVTLRATTGEDPRRLRTRVELGLHAEAGDRSFARPLLSVAGERTFGSFGMGAWVSAGTAVGALPPQRLWQIGGVGSVRGHGAGSLRGESLWLARGEVTYGSPTLRLSLFADAGWAGPRNELFDGPPLRGAGTGLVLFDNLVRLDLARGIAGGGYRFYVRLGGGI